MAAEIDAQPQAAMVHRRQTMDQIVAVALQNQIQRVLPGDRARDNTRGQAQVCGGRRGHGGMRGRGGRPRNENGQLLPNGRLRCEACLRTYTVGMFGK